MANTPIRNIAPPNLPMAPQTYSPMFFEQNSNVLRLYFTKLTNFVNNSSSNTFSKEAVWSAAAALVVPVANVPIVIPVDCTLQKVIILTNGGVGSCTVDIWKDRLINYPPTVADTICGGVPPAIAAGITYQNSILAGWKTTFAQNDVLMFNLSSSATFTYVSVQLRMQV